MNFMKKHERELKRPLPTVDMKTDGEQAGHVIATWNSLSKYHTHGERLRSDCILLHNRVSDVNSA